MRWILVAESSRARIFEQPSPTGVPEELQGFSHTESRRHESELTSDLPGHGFDGKHQGQHAMSSATSAKEHEAIVFAKMLCEHVEAARKKGCFDQLIVIAPPDFLGILRKHLPELSAKAMIESIPKNLVHQSAEGLHAYLPGSHLKS